MTCRNSRTTGMTLVELLVVLGIISILMGLLLPAVQSAREAVRSVQCKNKIRQLALGLSLHETALNRLPIGHERINGEFPYQTWLAKVLPYIELGSLSEKIRGSYLQSSNPFDRTFHMHFNTPVHAFACPSDPRVDESYVSRGKEVAMTSFVGVNGTNFKKKDGVLYFGSKTKYADVTDGLSNTIAIIERPPSKDFFFGWWYAGFGSDFQGAIDATIGTSEINTLDNGHIGTSCPSGPYKMIRRLLSDVDAQCGIFHPWSLHADGVQASRLDGSIITIHYEIEPAVLRSLSTKNGGEVVFLGE